MATISTTARPAYVYDAGGDQWVPIAWTVLGSGAASAPALTFTGDSNTGLWSPGADTVAFSTGGVERLRIDSSGQITTGLGSAAAPVLSFSGDTNTGVFSPFADAVSLATNGVERFRINSAGTAMIGDTSRNTVYVTSEFTPGFQSAVGSGTGGFYRYTANADGAALVFSKSRNATAGSHTVVNSGDTVGYIGFAGSDGTAFRTAATIFAQVDGTPGASDMPGRLIFTTTSDGSATPTERMRIDSAGNVGIGTSSPVSLLHVDGGIVTGQRYANSGALILRRANGSAATPTAVSATDGVSVIVGRAYDGVSTYRDVASIGFSASQNTTASQSGGYISLSTTPDGSTSTSERMRIDNAGLITGTGTSLGAWTAYTPTLGGTGWALGNGTVTGAYCRIGKFVAFRVRITLGSTSTAGASALTVSLPVEASGSMQPEHSVPGVLLDLSLTARYSATATWSTSTTILPRTVSNMTALTTNAPFTWADGDIIGLNGTYEAA